MINHSKQRPVKNFVAQKTILCSKKQFLVAQKVI